MKDKILALKRLIDDVRYDLTRTRVQVEDTTWDLLNKASKDSGELVISFEDLLTKACEEYVKKELDSDKKDERI